MDSSQLGAEITSLVGQLGDVGSVTRGRGQDIQVPIWALNRNQSSIHTLEKETVRVDKFSLIHAHETHKKPWMTLTSFHICIVRAFTECKSFLDETLSQVPEVLSPYDLNCWQYVKH